MDNSLCQAYVDMFSKSLNLEYGSYGISVQNQAPAYVATKMSKIRHATIDAPSPAKWVASAIKHIGYEATSCPYWCVTLLDMAPRACINSLSALEIVPACDLAHACSPLLMHAIPAVYCLTQSVVCA